MSINALIDQCGVLEQGPTAPLSVILYQTWLKRSQSPHAHLIYFNLGAALNNLGEVAAAEDAYRQALALSPGFVQPRINLGLLLERKGEPEKAIEEWTWVAQNIADERTDYHALLKVALNNLGRILEARKQYKEALDYLSRSLCLDPEQADVIHHWVFLRQKQCCWPIYAPIGNVRREFMEESTSALAMIALTDDPALQLAAARRYIAKKVPASLTRLAPSTPYGHRRIRIGYCSSDFCLHPVSMLMVELFELHDREQFEIYGYCWSPEDGSTVRNRVIAAMDHFKRIDGLTDDEAAKLIRSDEIDILFDLQGQTSGARMNIIEQRPAPIQITYLGLPATTGLAAIDYVIADHFLIPEEERSFYSETPLYMPDTYQVSDRKRPVGPIPSRLSCGLPEDAFVFCSFNNNFKYTPEMFQVWMSILDAVPGSLLWLLADNPWAESNLKNEAGRAGIDPNRLIFATRVSPENYLARYRIADLFLDSFPFNAGTTANDALWMGLPVLTRSGRTFASRMAGALLTASNAPELISYSMDEYRAKAIALGSDRQRCAALRQRLENERVGGKLFDTPQFVRNLESRLTELLQQDTLVLR